MNYHDHENSIIPHKNGIGFVSYIKKREHAYLSYRILRKIGS